MKRRRTTKPKPVDPAAPVRKPVVRKKGYDPAPVLDIPEVEPELSRADWKLISQLLNHPQFDNSQTVGRLRFKVLRELTRSLNIGEQVFQIALPLEMAPTMNTYANMDTWMLQKLRKELDARIKAIVEASHGCMALRGDPRLVDITRFSSSEMDEVTVDVAGGKMIVDRLVMAGVLAGDTRELARRRARWVRCSPGKGGLLVRIFNIEAGQQAALF